MSTTPDNTARRVIVFLALGFIVACVGVGCFTIGTVQRNNEQAARQTKAETLSSRAVAKSAKAVTRTDALSVEAERILGLAVKNCEREQFYLSTSADTRTQSARNADEFNSNSAGLAKAFAARPGFANVSALFTERSILDLRRAHIARNAQAELASLAKVSCSLNLPVGKS